MYQLSTDLLEVQISQTETDHSVAFPQADDFGRLGNLLIELYETGSKRIDALFNGTGLTERQQLYYVSALVWMKVVSYDRNTRTVNLERPGLNILLDETVGTWRGLARRAMSNEVFWTVARQVSRTPLSHDIKMRNMPNLSEVTIKRRMQTVHSWLRFFQENGL